MTTSSCDPAHDQVGRSAMSRPACAGCRRRPARCGAAVHLLVADVRGPDAAPAPYGGAAPPAWQHHSSKGHRDARGGPDGRAPPWCGGEPCRVAGPPRSGANSTTGSASSDMVSDLDTPRCHAKLNIMAKRFNAGSELDGCVPAPLTPEGIPEDDPRRGRDALLDNGLERVTMADIATPRCRPRTLTAAGERALVIAARSRASERPSDGPPTASSRRTRPVVAAAVATIATSGPIPSTARSSTPPEFLVPTCSSAWGGPARTCCSARDLLR